MFIAPHQQITQMDDQLAIPRDNGELVFQAPWEVRAFGMAVALNEGGVYPWRDFSQGLAAVIAAAERNGIDSSYYERWLATLEKLAITQGLVRPDELATRAADYASGVHDDHHDQAHREAGQSP